MTAEEKVEILSTAETQYLSKKVPIPEGAPIDLLPSISYNITEQSIEHIGNLLAQYTAAVGYAHLVKTRLENQVEVTEEMLSYVLNSELKKEKVKGETETIRKARVLSSDTYQEILKTKLALQAEYKLACSNLYYLELTRNTLSREISRRGSEGSNV